MMILALLLTAILFGGMILYSFGFAAFLFSALPADVAGPVIRKAFPHFYLFVLVSSAVAAALSLPSHPAPAAVLAAIAVTTIFARQGLMPAINAATDSGNRSRFRILHGLSVVVAIVQIAAAGWAILALAAI